MFRFLFSQEIDFFPICQMHHLQNILNLESCILLNKNEAHAGYHLLVQAF